MKRLLHFTLFIALCSTNVDASQRFLLRNITQTSSLLTNSGSLKFLLPPHAQPSSRNYFKKTMINSNQETETDPLSLRKEIYNLFDDISPYDEIEKAHKKTILEWINSSNEIFRIQKPNIPPQHLVAYFVLLDEADKSLLLVDHKNAQLWLTAGGHVEINEHPKITVERECEEELNTKADFWNSLPVFLTVTPTVGLTSGHTDVGIWYVLKGKIDQEYKFDNSEFTDIKWFKFKDIPYAKADPNMERFVEKLKFLLERRKNEK